VLFLAALAGCAAAPSAEVVKLDTDDQKTLYALGMAMSQQLTSAGFSEADTSVIAAGLADGLLGRTARVEMQVYGPQINGMLQTRSAATKDLELKERREPSRLPRARSTSRQRRAQAPPLRRPTRSRSTITARCVTARSSTAPSIVESR
jgi:hypothetical protein